MQFCEPDKRNQRQQMLRQADCFAGSSARNLRCLTQRRPFSCEVHRFRKERASWIAGSIDDMGRMGEMP
jgi:hypothetical protein